MDGLAKYIKSNVRWLTIKGLIDHAYCSFRHAESWVFENRLQQTQVFKMQQTQVFKIGGNRYTLKRSVICVNIIDHR